mgnify:CR=1 FL=1
MFLIRPSRVARSAYREMVKFTLTKNELLYPLASMCIPRFQQFFFFNDCVPYWTQESIDS